jgi:hypothetical protein
MFSGISGAALLTPFFVLGFPVMGVPTLTLVQAIGTSLFLETSGFCSGVVGTHDADSSTTASPACSSPSRFPRARSGRSSLSTARRRC